MTRKGIFFALLPEILKTSLLYLFVCCFAFINLRSQTRSFSYKAQKLIGTFSVYHLRPIQLNETTAAETADLFISELDNRGTVLKQSDVALLQNGKAQLFSQIAGYNDAYFKQALSVYLKALNSVDSILTVLSGKSLNFTENDTAIFLPLASKATYSSGLKSHARRLEKNIKFRCYERVFNIDGSDKFSEAEFNAKAKDVSKTIIANFQKKIRKEISEAEKTVESTLLNAIALRHDPHSNYFNKEQNTEFSKQLSAKVESFGLYLDEDDDGNITVAYIEPGGAAWMSNEINEGDLFVSLRTDMNTYTNEGYTAADIQEKLDNGSDPKAILVLKKKNGQEKTIRLLKQKTGSLDNSVKGYVLKGASGKTGYISLPSFYTDMENATMPGCANDVAKEILKLEGDSINGLIIDLRNNGGGSMQEAMNLAGIFVDEGPLFIYKEKTKKPYLLKDINRGSIFKKPLVVMVNEISASASELFANIVKDYNIGIVVGQTTYGKGTAQNILPLDTNALRFKSSMTSVSDFIKITNGKFYRLNCSTHQGTGVVPDITMPDSPGYGMYKENKEAFYIEPDVIVKNVVYTPNPAIDKASLQQKSAARLASSSDFLRYKQSADSMLAFLNQPQKVILKFASFKAYKQSTDRLYKSYEHAVRSGSHSVECLNNTFDQKISEVNEQSREFNSKVRELIEKNIFINEAFYILNDLKQQHNN